MIAVNGIYENGIVTLEKRINRKKTAKVIVTFLDEDLKSDVKRLTINNFSFKKARENSKRYKGSISDAIIDERRSYL